MVSCCQSALFQLNEKPSLATPKTWTHSGVRHWSDQISATVQSSPSCCTINTGTVLTRLPCLSSSIILSHQSCCWVKWDCVYEPEGETLAAECVGPWERKRVRQGGDGENHQSDIIAFPPEQRETLRGPAFFSFLLADTGMPLILKISWWFSCLSG